MQALSRTRFLTHKPLLHMEHIQVHEHEYPYASGKSGRTGECERRLVRPTPPRTGVVLYACGVSVKALEGARLY